MSAALLASLFTVIAASSALASVTVTSAGNVPQGGTSAGTVTFVLTEQAVNSIPTNAAGSIDIVMTDSAGGSTVEFDGTPVVSGPGSLNTLTATVGTSGGAANGTLTIAWTHSDPGNIESITITGLAIDADSNAATGAIKATLANVTGNASIAGFQGGGTASGVLASGTPIGTSTALVNVTTTGCAFVNTGSGSPAAGSYAFAVGAAGTTAESLSGTATGLPAPPAAQQQTLTITTAGGFASIHNAGDVVTQTNGCAASGVLGSPGTVVAALAFNKPATNFAVFPGENNSGPVTPLVLVEPKAGFLPAASTFTYTIATPGVVFSQAPTVSAAAGTLVLNEVQTVTITGGNSTDAYTLALGVATTAAIAFNATAATVQGALNTALTPGTVTVTGSAGGPYTITFTGTFAGLNQAPLVAAETADTDASMSEVIATVTDGGTLGATTAPVLTAPVLSADRKSATVTVTTASTGAGSTITLSNILYDVAATVPGGTFISVGVTTSGSLAVLPASRTNAVVFRGITATAPSPIVYIGENNQAAGLISFTESAAGFFTASPGPNNTFQICPSGVLYAFTTAPYAKVVGGVAAGNLILRDGAAASTTNIVKGTQNVSSSACYFWTVWTASTTASTIQIGNSDLTTGPLINVTVAQAPGPVVVNLSIGSSALATQLVATVQFATAMYRNQVAVTALSQPTIAAGSLNAKGGNIQIAETGLGQLKAGESICFEVLPRTAQETVQDTFLNALNTADRPVATSSGTGLVIGPVTASTTENCANTVSAVPAAYAKSFRFQVLQQSTAGDGKVVISNINYTTTADAHAGPVQLSVFGLGGSPTTVIFHSTVSNAKIGVAAGPADAWIARGLNVRAASAFGLATAITTRGHYVTVRARITGAGPGTLVQIWVKTKTTAWKLETSRRVSTNGYMYYSGHVLNLGYRYYRVNALGATSNTVRAYGK